jgi:hypothetical protein
LSCSAKCPTQHLATLALVVRRRLHHTRLRSFVRLIRKLVILTIAVNVMGKETAQISDTDQRRVHSQRKVYKVKWMGQVFSVIKNKEDENTPGMRSLLYHYYNNNYYAALTSLNYYYCYK